jgi:DNA modification methylase
MILYKQPSLPLWESLDRPDKRPSTNPITNNNNALDPADRPFHDWYRFVLSFPPHLVRDYLANFGLDEGSLVLDPFCGTGTTLVEAKLNRIRAVGVEANPFPHFASTVKLDWTIAPETLSSFAEEIGEKTSVALNSQGIDDQTLSADPRAKLRTLPPQAERALISNAISPLPLHKSLVLLEQLNGLKNSPAYKYGLLALGSALVNHIGNLKFGPEVGVGKLKLDAPVVAAWKSEMRKMVADLRTVQEEAYLDTAVHLNDARDLAQLLPPNSVDAVITSPPYPNEKDYTRTTRLESVVLGFFTDMAQLRSHKQRLLRSNTRGVYKIDDDDQWIAHNRNIQKLAETIEQRRLELGKTSGFERLYARVTRLYFGGMARHLAGLTAVLKPGAQLAYVVGDQASYLQILIKTGELLAEIAAELGYEVQRIDLFRTRFATATQTELREEVLILRWPGKDKR